MTIPKILHFVWIGDETNRPDGCIDSWRRLNPEYEVRIWGNRELQERTWINGAHIEAMLQAELCGVADMMRYEILYFFGGIAIDADSLCVRPLEDWLLEPSEFAVWSNELYHPGLIANGIMGSVPESPFVAKLIMDLLDQETVVDRRAWISTGPQHLTNCWREAAYSLTIWPTHMFLPDFHSGPDYDGQGPIFARQFYGSTRDGLAPGEDAYATISSFSSDSYASLFKRSQTTSG